MTLRSGFHEQIFQQSVNCSASTNSLTRVRIHAFFGWQGSCFVFFSVGLLDGKRGTEADRCFWQGWGVTVPHCPHLTLVKSCCGYQLAGGTGRTMNCERSQQLVVPRQFCFQVCYYIQPFLQPSECYLFMCVCVISFCLFTISRAAPTAYGGSQARGLIGAIVTGLRQSHGNTGSKLCLQPTPQLMAMLDP